MNKTISRIVSVCLLVVASGVCCAAGHSHSGGHQDPSQKKDESPDQGASSGSFDAKAVTQEIASTANGGTRKVVANDSSDAKQIGLIRSTLKGLADGFDSSVFSTPMNREHGGAVASNALQMAAPGQLRVQYLEVRAGAELRYSSADPALAAALREWLPTQLPAETVDTPTARNVAVPEK